MKKLFIALLLWALPALGISQKVAGQANTGMPAPVLYDNGDPITLTYPCSLSVNMGVLFYNVTSGAARPTWVCNGTTWIQSAAQPTFYNAAGVLTAGKCWNDSITTGTTGQGTVSWASAGFTTIPKVQTQIITTGTAASNAAFVGISSKTLTGANVTVTVPVTVSVLGALTVQLAAAAYTVDIQACGQ